MWVQTDRTDWQSSEVDKETERGETFHQVHVELQLLACRWISQKSELLSWEKERNRSAGAAQLMSCYLLTLGLLRPRTINSKCAINGKERLVNVSCACWLHWKWEDIHQNMACQLKMMMFGYAFTHSVSWCQLIRGNIYFSTDKQIKVGAKFITTLTGMSKKALIRPPQKKDE